MITTFISCWVFSVGLAYVLSIPCGMGLIGFYIGLACDEWVRAIFTFFRWKQRIRVLKDQKQNPIPKNA
jgi:Na+-driven multidrug efflux pump